MRTGDWITVSSGTRWFVTDPHAGDVKIEDIAHALSQICRFGGHCREFYSVAQHSLMVCDILTESDPFDYVLQMYGLVHDATEAYLGDIVRPLKRSMPEYRALEHLTGSVIFIGLNLPPLPEEQHAVLKNADNIALMTEARDLVRGGGADWSNPEEPLPGKIQPRRPSMAKWQFLQRYEALKECIALRGGAS